MTNNDILPLKRSKQVWIFAGVVMFIMVVSTITTCVYEDYRYEKQQALIGPTLPQESVGTSVDKAVGTAITTYLQTLDAEWSDQDCSPETLPQLQQITTWCATRTSHVHQIRAFERGASGQKRL